MKIKKEIKYASKKNIVVDFVLYSIYIVAGALLMKYPQVEVLNPVRYVVPLFYIFAFFSLLSYIVNRRKGDYEFLFLGLVNILTAVYVFVSSSLGSQGSILGNAILIYSIIVVINKSYHTYVLSKKNDIHMFPKFALTIMLALLGLLVISNFYKDVTMHTLVLGYYFLVFGFISILEPIMHLVLKNKRLNKYLVSLINDTMDDNKEKKTKKIKEVKTEKPKNKQIK